MLAAVIALETAKVRDVIATLGSLQSVEIHVAKRKYGCYEHTQCRNVAARGEA